MAHALASRQIAVCLLVVTKLDRLGEWFTGGLETQRQARRGTDLRIPSCSLCFPPEYPRGGPYFSHLAFARLVFFIPFVGCDSFTLPIRTKP